MLRPYDTTMSLFLTAVPIYEWEPVPPDAATAGATETADAANDLPPPLRLVFKGVRWVQTPVWGMRENPAWDQVAQDRRDEDERHSRERARQRVPGADGAPGTGGADAA